MEPLDNIVFNEFSSDWDGDIDNVRIKSRLIN